MRLHCMVVVIGVLLANGESLFGADQFIEARRKVSRLSAEADYWALRNDSESQIKAFEKALETALLNLGREDWQTHYVQSQLDELHHCQALDDTTAKLLEELRIEAKVGNMYERRGNLPALKASRLRSMGLAKRVFGEQSRVYGSTKLAVAQAYLTDASLDDAEDMANGALANLKAATGREHPQYLEALSIKASVLATRGARVECLAVSKEALELRAEMVGLEKPTEAEVKLEHAKRLLQFGEYRESSPIFIALLSSKGDLPAVHRQAIALMLGSMHLGRGNPAMVSAMVKHAKELQSPAQWSHPQVLQFAIRLQAGASCELDRFEEAAGFFSQESESRSDDLSQAAPFHLAHAKTLVRASKLEEASDLLERLLNAQASIEGLDALNVRIDIAKEFLATRQHAQAQKLVTACLIESRDKMRRPTLMLARLAEIESELAKQGGDQAAALTASNKAFSLRRELLGDTLYSLECYERHAQLLQEAGRPSESKALLARCSTIEKTVRSSLAECQKELKDYLAGSQQRESR